MNKEHQPTSIALEPYKNLLSQLSIPPNVINDAITEKGVSQIVTDYSTSLDDVGTITFAVLNEYCYNFKGGTFRHTEEILPDFSKYSNLVYDVGSSQGVKVFVKTSNLDKTQIMEVCSVKAGMPIAGCVFERMSEYSQYDLIKSSWGQGESYELIALDPEGSEEMICYIF